MGNGAGGEVEDNRLTVSPWCGEGNGVGAEQWAVRAMGHHTRHAVDHTQRHQAFIGKRLDIRPEGGKVVGIANGQDGNTGAAGLRHQQWTRCGQGGLGKPVAGVHGDKP
ncbi:hypothetical protein D3C78_1210470 [compost metagenome]